MTFSLLSIIQYNIRFIYKKVFFILAWITGVLIFHTFYNKGDSYHSGMDFYLVSIGIVQLENLHFIQMFILLLPYIGIAIIVDIYIAQMMGKHAINSLLRIEKRLLFIVSHILTLYLIIFVMLYVYYIMLLISSFTLYERTTQINKALFSWITLPQEDMLQRLVLPAFFGQFIGTFCITCVQLAVSIKFNRLSSGFIFIVFLYFFQLVFPFIIGQHAFVANILINHGTYFYFLFIQFVIIGISVGYLYVTSKKNTLFFSERG